MAKEKMSRGKAIGYAIAGIPLLVLVAKGCIQGATHPDAVPSTTGQQPPAFSAPNTHNHDAAPTCTGVTVSQGAGSLILGVTLGRGQKFTDKDQVRAHIVYGETTMSQESLPGVDTIALSGAVKPKLGHYEAVVLYPGGEAPCATSYPK